ncbi:MAG TPA: LysM peptidoglycan-binding domain-containing protein [Saprospiraceae bacterium]|nr:LysM peptidoglycan-binding domain-containing protein [Saprospiraceae bacterium]HMQ84497.1 LysM peptidoglycan-binding domain-containing protein [Saprospiraceae bacterium]
MKRNLSTIAFLLPAFLVIAQNSEHLSYIERYKEIAVEEMERTGIPASIKLAQGILESNAGKSELARKANNHFGIKCGSDWDGKKYYKEDDDYDDKGQLIESCFREYKDPESSYIAHSEFLRDPKKQYRYGFLFRLDQEDYKGWAKGLKSAGYATSASYDYKLIDIIERYELFRFDALTRVDIVEEDQKDQDQDDPTTRPPDQPNNVGRTGVVYTNNDVKYVLAASGDTPAEIARQNGIKLSQLLSFNEGLKTGHQELKQGEVVYIQNKRSSYRGRKTWHYVKEAETVYGISQLYGITEECVYKRNKLQPGMEPAINERLKLRGSKVNQRPKLKSEVPDRDKNTNAPDEDKDGLLDMIEEDSPNKEPELPPSKTEDTKPTPTNPPVKETTPEVKPTPNPKPDTGFDEEEVKPTPPTPSSDAVYHTVQTGDTLWNISQRYGTTVEKIKALNNLSTNTISVGMKLRVK